MASAMQQESGEVEEEGAKKEAKDFKSKQESNHTSK